MDIQTINEIIVCIHSLNLPEELNRIITDFVYPKSFLKCSYCNLIISRDTLNKELEDVIQRILRDSKLLVCGVCFKKYKIISRIKQ